jgi:hypothetical protein
MNFDSPTARRNNGKDIAHLSTTPAEKMQNSRAAAFMQYVPTISFPLNPTSLTQTSVRGSSPPYPYQIKGPRCELYWYQIVFQEVTSTPPDVSGSPRPNKRKRVAPALSDNSASPASKQQKREFRFVTLVAPQVAKPVAQGPSSSSLPKRRKPIAPIPSDVPGFLLARQQKRALIPGPQVTITRVPAHVLVPVTNAVPGL